MTFSARIFSVAACLMFAFAIGTTSPASAKQNFADSLGDLSQDSDGPIEITADSNQMDRNANVMTFIDNVVVKRGQVTLTTDRLVVHFQQDVNDIQRIEAFGNVVVVSEDQTATSETADFNVISEVIVMQGDVFLTQGDNKAQGTRLTVNLAEGTTKLDANEGRVRAIFTPEKAPQQ